MRRAAVSVASNIAEGHSRRSTIEFLRFLNIAYGSRAELETQVLLSQRLKFVDETESQKLLAVIEEIARIINGLSTSLKKKQKPT
jgi:four helix bundle protein